MASIKQLVQDFRKEDLIRKDITKEDLTSISALEQESKKLQENILKMRRSRGQYSRWVNYFDSKNDVSKLYETEEALDRVEAIIKAQKNQLEEVYDEIDNLRGLDTKIKIYGFSTREYKKSELFKEENPMVKILKDQLEDLNAKKNDDLYWSVRPESQRKGLEIQIQKVKAALKSIKTGRSTQDILEETRSYKEARESKEFSQENDYPVFFDIIGRSVTIY